MKGLPKWLILVVRLAVVALSALGATGVVNPAIPVAVSEAVGVLSGAQADQAQDALSNTP